MFVVFFFPVIKVRTAARYFPVILVAVQREGVPYHSPSSVTHRFRFENGRPIAFAEPAFINVFGIEYRRPDIVVRGLRFGRFERARIPRLFNEKRGKTGF